MPDELRRRHLRIEAGFFVVIKPFTGFGAIKHLFITRQYNNPCYHLSNLILGATMAHPENG